MHRLEDEASKLAQKVGCVTCVLGDRPSSSDDAGGPCGAAAFDPVEFEPYEAVYRLTAWPSGEAAGDAAGAGGLAQLLPVCLPRCPDRLSRWAGSGVVLLHRRMAWAAAGRHTSSKERPPVPGAAPSQMLHLLTSPRTMTASSPASTLPTNTHHLCRCPAACLPVGRRRPDLVVHGRGRGARPRTGVRRRQRCG